MWILFLILQINFNTHSEYWLYSDSLSEHFEVFGSISKTEGKFKPVINYFIEDNIYSTKRKYKLFPSLRIKTQKMQLVLGFFHKTILSGLLLNQDYDIQYKRFRYIKGIGIQTNYRNFQIGLFTGFPKDLEFDGFSYSSLQDTQSIIRGISGIFDLSNMSVAMSYLRLNRKNMPAPYAFSEIGGIGIDLTKNIFSLSFDAAMRQGVDFITYTRKKGNGVFLSMEFAPEKYNILLQLARYDSISFYNLNLPPVPLKTEILPSSGNSDKGGSFTFILPLQNGSIETGFGGLYSLNENNFLNPTIGRAFQEIYFETERYYDRISYSLKSGFEHRLRIEPEYTHLKDVYVEQDLELPKLSFEGFLRIDRFSEDTMKYFKGTFNTTFYITSNLNLQVLLEYASLKVSRYGFENFWPGIEVSLNIEGGNISLFYGKQRGGLVCSGGMCRITPRFNGLKLIVSKSI